MSSIGEIYVDVRGDITQFKKDMTALYSVAKKGSKQVSEALNNGIMPDKASKSISALSTGLKQLAQSAKVPAANFTATTNEITRALEDVAKEAGMTTKQFAALNEKMLRTQVMKTAEQSMRKVANVAGLTKKEIKALGLQMGYTGKQATAMADKIRITRGGIQKLGSSLMTTRARIISVGLAFAAVGYTVKRTSEAIWEAGQRTLVAENAYKSITGSVEAADKQFAFLRDTSKELGLNFYTLREGYKGFLAAANSSTLPMKEIQKIFTSVSNAGAILGLSNEKMSLTFLALEQMLSKGKVSMEEIRRQMGDSLPGAFQLGAKAMGMTVEAFDKAVSAGKVYADDFLPKFSRAMDAMYIGTIADSVKAVNLLKQSWEDLLVDMAKGGFMDEVSSAILDLTTKLQDPEFVKAATAWATSLADALRGAVSAVGLLMKEMVRVTNFFRLWEAESQGKISWNEWFGASPGEAAEILKGLDKIELAAIRGQVAIKDIGIATQEEYSAALKKTRLDLDQLLKENTSGSGLEGDPIVVSPDAIKSVEKLKKEIVELTRLALPELNSLMDSIANSGLHTARVLNDVWQDNGLGMQKFIDEQIAGVNEIEEAALKSYAKRPEQILIILEHQLALYKEYGNKDKRVIQQYEDDILSIKTTMGAKALSAQKKIADEINKLTMTDREYKINALNTWYAEQVAIDGVTAALKKLYELKLAMIPEEENIPLETATRFLKEELEKAYEVSMKLSKVDYSEVTAAFEKQEASIAKIADELNKLTMTEESYALLKLKKTFDERAKAAGGYTVALQAVYDIQKSLIEQKFMDTPWDAGYSKWASAAETTKRAAATIIKAHEDRIKAEKKAKKAAEVLAKAIASINDEYNKLTMTASAYAIYAIETWYAEQVAIMGVTAALKELYRVKLAGVPDEENIPAETSAQFLKEDLEKEYSIRAKMGEVDYGEINAVWKKIEDEKLKIREEAGKIYNELGKTQFDIEREQLLQMDEIYKKADVDKETRARILAAKMIDIARAEQLAKLDIYQNLAGGIANTFQMIAQAGAKQSKEAFIAYKAFAMVEAAIAGHKAIINALATPVPWPMPQILAVAAGAAAAIQIGMIASAQPPSYVSGGISSARGIYQTGDISEAHIPVPSGGKIPVKVEEKESKPREIVIMNAVHPSVFDEYQSSSRGQKAFLNLISSNAGSIRRIIR